MDFPFPPPDSSPYGARGSFRDLAPPQGFSLIAFDPAVNRMSSSVLRLKFLVTFAYSDLDRYREGDWLNLWDDLGKFLLAISEPDESFVTTWRGDYQGKYLRHARTPRGKGAQRKMLRKIQRDLVLLFDVIVAEVTAGENPGKHDPDIAWPSLRFRPAAPGTRGRLRVAVTGDVRDVVLWKAVQDLLRFPNRPLLRCPSCGTVFYRVRRQTHCTRTCFKKHYDANRAPQAKNQKRTRDRAAAKQRRLAAAKAKWRKK